MAVYCRVGNHRCVNDERTAEAVPAPRTDESAGADGSAGTAGTGLTLAEQASLTAGDGHWRLHGVPRLDLPAITVADGPHGVRKPIDGGMISDSEPATCFPTASALAASWDVGLLADVGTALGEQARAAGVSVLLGPGVNIKRSALCGRNFEYFSEDPYQSSRMAAAWINGVQSTGVGASIKHFAANNQEHFRFRLDAIVDERALREIYLASFEYPVRTARPATVMAAYNRVNGAFCSENAELLTRVLRGDWGYSGLVVSDWGACFDRVASVRAGLDLQMPAFDGQGDVALVAAVGDGTLPAAALERAAAAVTELISRTAPARAPHHPADLDAHHALARRAAAAGTVLLKNEGGLLPLSGDPSVAVIGAFAKSPRYQGAGSSGVHPHRLDDLWTSLSEAVPGRLHYADGYPRVDAALDPSMIAEARDVAAQADIAIVVIGLPEEYETEGLDRAHLNLPASHDALVDALTAVNPHVIVVLCNGAPVAMPWAEHVPVIVEAYLGGEAGGAALADVLLGAAEPGGRLAETFPLRLTDNPAHVMPNGPRQVQYRESVYVGYRFYDSAGIDVLYPFGHGLGYTTFAWSEAALSRTEIGPDDAVEVTLTVTNTGDRAGSEVVQVYVQDVESTVFRPVHELAGFAKVTLEPGARADVVVRLEPRAFAFWDTTHHNWYAEPGEFEILVGASSRDIRSRARLNLSGPARELTPGPAVYHRIHLMRTFDEESFAQLYGGAMPDDPAPAPGRYTVDTPIAEMRHPAARMLRALMARRAAAATRSATGTPLLAPLIEGMLSETTPRMLPMLTRGRISAAAATAFVRLANGHPVSGWNELRRTRRAGRAACR